MQRGDDPECVFFQEMADRGHYGGRPGSTRQGIYVCAPSGKFLASINSTNADRVLAMMHDGLNAWRFLPDEQRQLAADSKIKPEHRWEDSYPTDGLVLNMYTRDLPEEEDPDATCAVKWNQDRVWFSASEARQWLPPNVASESESSLPRPLLERLVRLHLVDTVKGQTSTFASRNLADDTAINVKITELTETYAKLEISGKTRAESTRQSRRTSPHSVSTVLIGHATFNLGQSKFTEFEIVAIGKRRGYTVNNGRRRDPVESPIGFVFRLASPEEPRIAPAFIASYRADWISRPKGARSRQFNPDAVFDSRDANNDGKLSGEEISERMREQISLFDADRDGLINKREFEDGVRRLLNSERRK